MKKYIRNGNTDYVRDTFKIRLRMWDIKRNYPNNDKDTIWPI